MLGHGVMASRRHQPARGPSSSAARTPAAKPTPQGVARASSSAHAAAPVRGRQAAVADLVGVLNCVEGPDPGAALGLAPDPE